MGVPLLFCVGATQPKVTLVLEVVEPLDPDEPVEPVEPDEPDDPVEPVVDPDVEPDVELPPESAAVCGGVVPVVLLEVLVAAVDEPDSSSPQPASATPKIPNTTILTIRPDPDPRSAFCMQPPKNDFQCPGQACQSHNQAVARACSTAIACCLSRGGASAPATPLS